MELLSPKPITIDSKLVQPENGAVGWLTFVNLSPLKSKFTRLVHPSNIYEILVNRVVSLFCPTVKSARLVHPANILSIDATLDVLSVLISRLSRLEHLENI